MSAELAATVNPVLEEEAGLSRRDSFNAWFVRHEVSWELAMAALAIVYVAVAFAADDVPAGQQSAFEAIELGLTGVFLLEFASRFAAARSRRAYLKGHWIDLVALLPSIRALRAFRLLRLLRLVRAFAGLYRVAMHVHALAMHRGFAWLILTWLAIMLLCSAWLYAAEQGLNEAIASPFDALWWGIVTLTTVGYGDVYPVTQEGRLAAMALMLLGIVLFGAITSTITSYLLSRDSQTIGEALEAVAERSLASELERLAALHRAGDLSDHEFAAAKSRLLTD